MKKTGLKTGLFCLIFLICSHQTIFCNPLEQTGLTPLRAIQPSLTGANVKVAQPEATSGSNDWQINPATVGQPQSKFRWISNGGTATSFPNALGIESGHANFVGLNFFGNPGGMAPGVTQIDNYEAEYFVNTFVDTLIPSAIPAKIVNQSFTYDAQNSSAEQKFDNYAATYNVLFVSGIGNGTPAEDTEVLPPGTAYNGIGVGAFGNSSASSVGPTVDGRCKPDITAPAGFTSFSTPYVSGAAALLVQAGSEGLGGANTNAATDIRTLKTLLLNGAVKPSGWTNHPSHPLDLRFGSGVLNVFNSFKQLSAGKQAFLEATSHSADSAHPPGTNPNNLSKVGWDFNTITTAPGQDRVHHYYFSVPAGAPHKFTATLGWNRNANVGTIKNLNLFLYNTPSESPVTLSTSLVDNVEHIFVKQLPPGRYDLQVWKGDNILETTETYALAFEAVATAIEINRFAENIQLNWPVYPHGFTLESAANLNTPVSWSPVVASSTITNQQYQLVIPSSQPQQYYRLRQP